MSASANVGDTCPRGLHVDVADTAGDVRHNALEHTLVGRRKVVATWIVGDTFGAQISHCEACVIVPCMVERDRVADAFGVDQHSPATGLGVFVFLGHQREYLSSSSA